MIKKEKELRNAFLEKEKGESYLTNLEKVKDEGATNELQYNSMKNEYNLQVKNANLNIERIKDEIGKELESAENELQSYIQDLNNIDVRFKIGELSSEDYQKAKSKITNNIERMQTKTSELKKLIDSKSSSDIGIPLDTKTTAAEIKPVIERKAKKWIASKSNKKDLKSAFLDKERAETYLDNLEKVKEEGATNESQYNSMKNEYLLEFRLYNGSNDKLFDYSPLR